MDSAGRTLVLPAWVSPFGHLRLITPACGSPGLIAACHVLHRLLLPRHPPCALSSLTIKFTRHTPASPSLVITNLHLSFRAKHPPEILSFRAKRGICFPFVQQEPRFSRHTP